jgi:hypothetical protein
VLKDRLQHTIMNPEQKTRKLENAKIKLGVYRRALLANKDAGSVSDKYQIVYDNGIGKEDLAYADSFEGAVKIEKSFERKLGGYDDTIESEIFAWNEISGRRSSLAKLKSDGGLKLELGFDNETAYIVGS